MPVPKPKAKWWLQLKGLALLARAELEMVTGAATTTTGLLVLLQLVIVGSESKRCLRNLD